MIGKLVVLAACFGAFAAALGIGVSDLGTLRIALDFEHDDVRSWTTI